MSSHPTPCQSLWDCRSCRTLVCGVLIGAVALRKMSARETGGGGSWIRSEMGRNSFTCPHKRTGRAGTFQKEALAGRGEGGREGGHRTVLGMF